MLQTPHVPEAALLQDGGEVGLDDIVCEGAVAEDYSAVAGWCELLVPLGDSEGQRLDLLPGDFFVEAGDQRAANHPGTPGAAAKRRATRLGEIAKAAPELSPVTSGSISEAARRPDWRAPCIHARSSEACSPAK